MFYLYGIRIHITCNIISLILIFIYDEIKSRLVQQKTLLNLITVVNAAPNQSLVSTSTEGETLSEKERERSRKKDQRGKKNWSTLRRREVVLSKISIYIVFMFISCHR